MTGSGLFTNKGAVQPRFIEGKGGVAGEVGDLRQDVASALKYMCAITVAEFTNALATATDNLMEATASQLAARRLLPAALPATGALTQATITNLLAGGPRQLRFVTAGATPAHQPDAATVEGWDERGVPQTEVVPLKQEAGEFLSTRFWSNLKHIDLGEGGGTGATLAIGLGGKLGLASNPKLRAGRKAVIQEVSGGSVVTTGTVNRAEDGTASGVTGTVDLVTPTPVMPTTETLVVAIDGGADQTVTFASPADLADIVAAINAECGAGFASASTNYLQLTSPTTGVGSSIDIKAASTSLTILGLTAGLVKGLGNGLYGSYTPSAPLDGSTDFALTYEYVPD